MSIEKVASGSMVIPISSDMLAIPVSSSNVSLPILVSVNGISSTCKNVTECMVSILTTANTTYYPFVTSVSPKRITLGSKVTILGGNFLPTDYTPTYDDMSLYSEVTDTITPSLNASVTFQSLETIICDIESINSTVIVCLIVDSAPAGFNMKVHVKSNFGAALYSTGLVAAVFDLSLSKSTPTLGAFGGGTVIEISGLGFNSEEDTLVELINGSKIIGCSTLSTSKISVTCITDPFPESFIPDLDKNGELEMNVKVSILDTNKTEVSSSLLTNAFTFSPKVSGTISSVVPSSGSLSGGDLISLSGSGLNSTTTGDKTQVFIGEFPCEVTSVNTTTILCITQPALTPGNYSIYAVVGNNGRATYNGNFSYELSFTQISQPGGSFYGGQELMLLGSGYCPRSSPNCHKTTSMNIEVKLGNDTCILSSSSYNNITCITQVPSTRTYYVTTEINPNTFSPSTILINIGDSVDIYWRDLGRASDGAPHIFQVYQNGSLFLDVPPGVGFASDDISSTGFISLTFMQAGDYFFKNQLLDIVGKIIVVDSIANKETTSLNVTVSVNGNVVEDKHEYTFNKLLTPSIATLKPINGSSFLVTGSNFGNETIKRKVIVGDQEFDPVFIDSTTFQINHPIMTAGVYTVFYENDYGRSLPLYYQYDLILDDLIIKDLSGSLGGGSIIDLSGRNFPESQGDIKVSPIVVFA